MPAKTPKNPRRGNQAEDLGICLLSGIAAVARVPRENDVGHDAIATLLRDIPGRNFLAEESFWVQFKWNPSEGVRYDPEGVQWLRDLQIPFFMADVSLTES